MKIITDQNLIDYRIALQQQMYRSNSDFALFTQELRDKIKKNVKISEDDLRILRNKLHELGVMFYELEHGNYFARKSQKFQDNVLNALTKKFYGYINDQSIDDIFSFCFGQTYIDLEDELKKQIRKDKNGS